MKYLITFFFILFCFISFPQSVLSRYWGITEGHLKGSFIDDKKNTYTQLNLDFKLGKILGKRWVTGFGFMASTSITQNIKNPKQRFSIATTAISLFAQYHFIQREKTSFYIEPQATLSKIYTTNEAISLSSSGNRVDYILGSLALGNYYFINPSIAIKNSVNFSILEEKKIAATPTLRDRGNLTFNIGLQFFLLPYDINYRLPNKKEPQYALRAKTWSLEGAVASKNSAWSTPELQVSTGVHYFLFHHFSLGAHFASNYFHNTEAYFFLIKPSFRLYLPTKINYGYLQIGAGATQQREKINTTFRYSPNVFAEAQLGFGLFLSNNTALQGGIFYRYYTPWDKQPIFENNFRGLGTSIGIHYFL